MTRDELREKVARDIAEAYYRDLSDGEYGVADLGEAKEWFPEADAAIALVLEEAARVVEAIGPEWVGESVGGSIYDTHKSDELAAAIRALGGEGK